MGIRSGSSAPNRRLLWPAAGIANARQFGTVLVERAGRLEPPEPDLRNAGLVLAIILDADSLGDEDPLPTVGYGLPGVRAVLEPIDAATARAPETYYAVENGILDLGPQATTTGGVLGVFDVPAGDYRLRLLPPNGAHALECTSDIFDSGRLGLLSVDPNAIPVRAIPGGHIMSTGALACRVKR